MIRSLGFVDLFDVPANPIFRVRWLVESLCERSLWLDRLEDLSGGSDLQGSFSKDLHVLIVPSGGSSLLGSDEIFIRRCSRNSPSDLTWLISYPTIFSWFAVRHLPRTFSCWYCRAIYNSVEKYYCALCSLCISYKECMKGTKGILGVIMIS